LLSPQRLLQRLSAMEQELPEAELPSCNLILNARSRVIYPAIDSAEDHWLVAFLLIHHKAHGVLAERVYWADYSLAGAATRSNRQQEQYAASRRRLYDSACNWLSHPLPNDGADLLLGWGKEAMVWRRQNLINKVFYPEILDISQVQFLKTLKNNPFIPDANWCFHNGWIATYGYEESQAVHEIGYDEARALLLNCLDENWVFLDFARHNLRRQAGQLKIVDLGRDVRQFEIRYFRDLAARVFLQAVQCWSDEELKQITPNLRDREDALIAIPGFADFYRNLLLKWFDRCWADQVIPRIPTERKTYYQVTLLIKASAQDAAQLSAQVKHQVSMLLYQTMNRFADKPFSSRLTDGSTKSGSHCPLPMTRSRFGIPTKVGSD